jgi:xanthine dehydrogenase YagR molybdenum-binding subunit
MRADALEKVTESPATPPTSTCRDSTPRFFASGRERTSCRSTSRRRADSGVRGAVDHDDMPNTKLDGIRLFDREVHYAGSRSLRCAPIAEIARRAVDAIRLDIVEAGHAVDTAAALAPNAPLVRKFGNLTRHSPEITSRGDVDAGLRDAEATVTREYRTPCALHTPLEPHGSVAEWMGDDLTVWESTQGIFQVRKDIARAFRLPLNRVRVSSNYGRRVRRENGARWPRTRRRAVEADGPPSARIYDREG